MRMSSAGTNVADCPGKKDRRAENVIDIYSQLVETKLPRQTYASDLER